MWDNFYREHANRHPEQSAPTGPMRAASDPATS